jgi:hypothetical protein
LELAATLKMPLPLPSLAVPDKVVELPEMVLLLPVKATLGAVLSRVMIRAVALHTGVFTPSLARALKVLSPADRATLVKLYVPPVAVVLATEDPLQSFVVYRATLAPALAVPERLTVALFVMLSVLLDPVSSAAIRSGALTLRATLSAVILGVVTAAWVRVAVLPAASLRVPARALAAMVMVPLSVALRV